MTAAVLAVGFVAGCALAGRARHLAVATPPPGCRVSVIVPARNEAARLPRLLAALHRAEPRPAELVVVDDGSTDATAAIARRAGARVLASEPPPGWTGKAWACEQGAAAATGDVLVFLDADTEPAPALVGALAAAAVATGGLVSAHPRHRVERAYERLSSGPALVTLLGAGTGGPPTARWWRRPIAFGPALAMRSADHERLGGHAAVRGEVADDLALARAADAAGIPVHALLGGDLLAYRMYPEGLGGLVEGWSKNLATGAGATPPLRLAASVAWVTAALQAALLLVAARDAPAAIAYAAFAAQTAVLLRRVGRFGAVTAIVYVVPLVAFLGLFARSLVLTASRRRVPWRGRHLPVRA